MPSSAYKESKATPSQDSSKTPESPGKQPPPILLFFVGLLLLLFGAVAAFLLPCPISETAYKVIRILLAVGGGFLGGSIPGFLSIRYKGFIQAGGGLAVFVVLFLWNPAANESYSDCPSPKKTIRPNTTDYHIFVVN